jgi:hypothetical protein
MTARGGGVKPSARSSKRVCQTTPVFDAYRGSQSPCFHWGSGTELAVFLPVLQTMVIPQKAEKYVSSRLFSFRTDALAATTRFGWI